MSSDEDYCDNADLNSEIPKNLSQTYYQQRDNPAEAHRVADHYNARPNVAPAQRTRSAIIHLREFHNWVKSVLIREFVSQRNLKVLDVACGKGGDLMKWEKAYVSVMTGVGKKLRECHFMEVFKRFN